MTSARRFAPILAAAAAIILVQQAADLYPILAGTDMQVRQSRFQLLAGLGGRGPAFVAADVLLVWATVSLADRAGARAVGVLHLALGVLGCAAVPLLIRDALGGASQSGTGFATYWATVLRTLLFALILGAGGLLVGRTLRAPEQSRAGTRHPSAKSLT